jgi:hypothetical protein
MRIHEAGRKRRIAQIDYLCVAWDRQIAPGIDNLIALHDYHAVLQERVRFAVKESRSFQDNSLIGSLRRNVETQENYKQTKGDFHSGRLEAIRHTGKK